MKIKCNNCKKTFDPEKHGDFCPHCGMFVSHEFNVGQPVQKQKKSAEPVVLSKEEQKIQKNRKSLKRYAVIVGILILIPILTSPISRWVIKRSYENNRKGVIEAQYYDLGEVIEVQNHEIRITDVQWLTGTHSAVIPEGHKLLEIAYKAKTQHGKVHLDDLSTVYLKCDGQYLKASVMESVKSSGYSYYDPSIREQYGVFGFVVPDTAQELELVIQVQSDTLKSVAKFRGTYAVKIER